MNIFDDKGVSILVFFFVLEVNYSNNLLSY